MLSTTFFLCLVTQFKKQSLNSKHLGFSLNVRKKLLSFLKQNERNLNFLRFQSIKLWLMSNEHKKNHKYRHIFDQKITFSRSFNFSFQEDTNYIFLKLWIKWDFKLKSWTRRIKLRNLRKTREKFKFYSELTWEAKKFTLSLVCFQHFSSSSSSFHILFSFFVDFFSLPFYVELSWEEDKTTPNRPLVIQQNLSLHVHIRIHTSRERERKKFSFLFLGGVLNSDVLCTHTKNVEFESS